MGLEALLTSLDRREAVTPVTPRCPPGVMAQPSTDKACTPVTPVTPIGDEGARETDDGATTDHAAELRALVACVAADWPADEQAEALALALADPASALTCFRALAVHQTPTDTLAVPDDSDPHMRTCRQCTNLSPVGRCMAAARREDFGVGVFVDPRYQPDPVLPQRCAPFVPLPGDPDQRTGRERWAFLFAETTRA